ncbi:unnamed protein product, partial [Arctogadus glacialis]
KDTATSLEVYWPDGRSVARHLEPWEINTVLHVPYPNEEEEVAATPTVDIECGHGFAMNDNGRCTDKDECSPFPSVCPPDRPVCTNTYGGFKCRSNKRCGQGYEPSGDGSACVAQPFLGGTRSSGVQSWPGRALWPLLSALLHAALP